MQKSNERAWATPDGPMHLGVNVKPQIAARKFSKTAFKAPELVLLRIEEITETRCALTRLEAIPLHRLTRKQG